MRVGINGFGRMGRLALRAGWASEHLEFVAVNEPHADDDALAVLLEFDTLHGRFDTPCAAGAGGLAVGDRVLPRSRCQTPGEIAWREHGVELVLECSGRFRERALLQGHHDAGARQVLVSAPVRDIDANIVFGVNHQRFALAELPVLSAASCTTNCLAPVVQVLHRVFGIERGLVTTIHAPTNTQEVLDLPRDGGDVRRSRAAAQHLIPTSTNSAYAVTLILPELAGKLDSVAVRNPCLHASLVDGVFQLSRDTTPEEVCETLRTAAKTPPLEGILGVEDRPLVSGDFSGDPRSAIVDAPSTRVTDGRLVKLLVWYDNEWGYVRRMIDLAEAIARARG